MDEVNFRHKLKVNRNLRVTVTALPDRSFEGIVTLIMFSLASACNECF